MSFYLNVGLDESRARIEGASFSSHPEILVYIYIYIKRERDIDICWGPVNS